MAFKVTHAVRLVRKDLERLTAAHQKQLIRMMAPGRTLDKVGELIETGAGKGAGDGGGLVYVRIEDGAQRAFEGWMFDDLKYPSTKVSPDGALFFVAGTTKRVGIEMSQSTWHQPTAALAKPLLELVKPVLKKLRVAVKGPALRANPPFAAAKAPEAARPAAGLGALELELVAARRLIEQETHKLPPDSRLQILHSLRPKFATPTTEGMEDLFKLGMVYGFIDPGPEEGSAEHKSGLIYVRLRSRKAPAREFEGWFYDSRPEEADSYWPSTRGTITEGRFFELGTIRYTGVEIRNSFTLGDDGKLVGKVQIAVDAKKGLPVAKALAAGVNQLGLSFDVEVKRKRKPSENGYFGSELHARQLDEKRGALTSSRR